MLKYDAHARRVYSHVRWQEVLVRHEYHEDELGIAIEILRQDRNMKPETILSWVARAWGVGSTLLLVAFMFGGQEHFRPTASEALALLFFPGGVILGFALAWWRELFGGLITVVSLALFHLYIFAGSGQFWLGPYFLLFAAPGFLHIVSALLASHRGRQRAPTADAAR